MADPTPRTLIRALTRLPPDRNVPATPPSTRRGLRSRGGTPSTRGSPAREGAPSSRRSTAATSAPGSPATGTRSHGARLQAQAQRASASPTRGKGKGKGKGKGAVTPRTTIQKLLAAQTPVAESVAPTPATSGRRGRAASANASFSNDGSYLQSRRGTPTPNPSANTSFAALLAQGAARDNPFRRALGATATAARKPARGPTRKRKATAMEALAPALTKSLFGTFAKVKVSREGQAIVQQGLNAFVAQLGDDLQAYAAHGKRKTIERSDVELLMARQRILDDNKPALDSVLHKHLPMELVEQVVAVAKAGNVIVPQPKASRKRRRTTEKSKAPARSSASSKSKSPAAKKGSASSRAPSSTRRR